MTKIELHNKIVELQTALGFKKISDNVNGWTNKRKMLMCIDLYEKELLKR